MTALSTDLACRAPALNRLRFVAACWLALGTLTWASSLAAAQTSDDPAIAVVWTVAPAELGPGSAFAIDGVVTIDPASAAPADEDGALAWTVTVGPIDDVAIDRADCGDTDGATCEADIDADSATVTFAGVVDDDPSGDVTANVTIAGTIDDELDRDAILFQAVTCGTVDVVSGTPAPGRLPVVAATPNGTCAGTAGTIEATVAPATEASTEAATPAPTEEPTATPESTATVPPTDVPTEPPTEAPTVEPTVTAEPTEPTATSEPTAEPTATSQPTETIVPTVAPTATSEPTAEPMATSEPTETIAPTATSQPTDEPAATSEPTTEPSATSQPTTAVEATDAPATEAPKPVRELDDDGGGDTGLWIGVGSLVVLAVAAGAVLYQRRKLSA